MKIARVEAHALALPVDFSELGVERSQTNSMCYAEVETDDGIVGHGVSSITQAVVVAEIINAVAGPAIIGEDALAHEKVWHTLYWTCTPWGQSGYASHAISAIDLALWDIKGKALGQPIWRLLGAARDRIEAYVTCGFSFLDRDQLADAMRLMVGRGYKAVKMQVGRPGLDFRKAHAPVGEMIREDIRRVAAVRDAVGAGVEIAIDAGCRLDLSHAVELARGCEPLGIAFFEEPIMQNDVALLAEMRRQTSIPLTAGQNEGQAFRFRDLLVSGAVNVVQPNVIITGGITQCVKIAGMAASFNVPISNGGGCPYHNMHLQAGVSNGTIIEYQVNSAGACKMFLDGLPEPKDGWLTLPETPGLGFEANQDAVREFSVK
ncbi:MAG: mandelate racemase/muconate lactonizing enzyme family protein [Alphaproteobacteria bacterium]